MCSSVCILFYSNVSMKASVHHEEVSSQDCPTLGWEDINIPRPSYLSVGFPEKEEEVTHQQRHFPQSGLTAEGSFLTALPEANKNLLLNRDLTNSSQRLPHTLFLGLPLDLSEPLKSIIAWGKKKKLRNSVLRKTKIELLEIYSVAHEKFPIRRKKSGCWILGYLFKHEVLPVCFYQKLPVHLWLKLPLTLFTFMHSYSLRVMCSTSINLVKSRQKFHYDFLQWNITN